MSENESRVRRMEEKDLKRVLEIQEESYREELLEEEEIFRKKLQSSGETCWVAELKEEKERDFEVKAYFVCYPWRGDDIPVLHSSGDYLVQEPDRFYFADLAVSPSARSKGLAASLIAEAYLFAARASFPTINLISLPSAVQFWTDQNFVPRFVTPDQQQLIDDVYGPGALCLYQDVSDRTL